MRTNIKGQLVDEPAINAGFIGCGSHSFRNLYPTLQFTPVNLKATCDLDADKAAAYAKQFGADNAYTDYHEMLEKEDLDAVFICTGYDKTGRPLYPKMAMDCMNAGCHAWIEKPPAATCADIEAMQKVSADTGKNVVTGLKKMFFPANEKAKSLMEDSSFGTPQVVSFTYPQPIPTKEELTAYRDGTRVGSAVAFLDHLCHPGALMVDLLGMPATLYYERSANGGGIATFTYAAGTVASILFTVGGSTNGGMEHTRIVGDKGQHITVENNIRLTLHRLPPLEKYGAAPSYFEGEPEKTAAVWEPEFSLGQLYNKALFIQGFFNEINEFTMSILEKRKPAKGTLEQAWMVTRLFEAFAEGPGKRITLAAGS